MKRIPESIIPEDVSKDLSGDELRQMVADNADVIYPLHEYKHTFTEREVQYMEEVLVAKQLELYGLEKHLERIKEEHKQKMDPLKSTIKECVKGLSAGSEMRMADAFGYRHGDKMALYNQHGKLIYVRDVNATEQQGTLMGAIREEE